MYYNPLDLPNDKRSRRIMSWFAAAVVSATLLLYGGYRWGARDAERRCEQRTEQIQPSQLEKTAQEADKLKDLYRH